jgi:hypothetical protein
MESNPQFNKAREAAAKYRDLLQQKADLHERLRRIGAQVDNLCKHELPDLMDQAGVDSIGLPANGNSPACDLTLVPFFNANISADWPEDKKRAAFDALKDYGHEELIKANISIALARHDHALLAGIIRALEPFAVDKVVREAVHHKTLTAWLQ